MDVVVSFYPLQFVTEAVGGRHVSVSNLTPPGADSHNVELPAAQVRRVLEADLVVYLSGFQPSTDSAVALRDRGPVVDTADVAAAAGDTAGTGSGTATPSPSDPLWLDPTLLAAAGHQVARDLATVDPANGDEYALAAERLAASLDVLDAEYAAGLAAYRGATLVTAHEAFGHHAARYGLRQVGIAGINPEVEPSPARLREVMEVVEANGVRTLSSRRWPAPGSPRPWLPISASPRASWTPSNGFVTPRTIT